MKLRAQTRGVELGAPALAAIQDRIRLEVGAHAAEIEELGLVLAPAPTRGVSCSVTLRSRAGEAMSLAEVGDEPDEAVDLVLWRLRHRLQRRALSRQRGQRT